MEINVQTLDRQAKYKLLIGGVLPRPIAWVSSQGKEGVVNVAPFSYFNVACIDPMMVSIAVARKPGGVSKDTARNIRETGEFVVNMVDVHNVEAVNQSSAEYPPDVSEAEELGLTLLASQKVQVPRVGESRIHFECKLHKIVELGDPVASDLIIGEVVHVHIDDDLYYDGKIDTRKFNPVSRLAGLSYATIGEIFDRPRPVIEKKE
jgi:flavin reductase (DIM6/NTAB) family NADH-FMN oxidoreductase RutF